MTDYTDPSTIDVREVAANINHDFRMRGHRWDDRLSWPNVTVKALVDEVDRLRALLEQVEAATGCDTFFSIIHTGGLTNEQAADRFYAAVNATVEALAATEDA